MSSTTLNLHPKVSQTFDSTSYSKTLQTMKVVHFKTYFEMQNSAKTNANVVVLPRLFKSFHPCPFKLMLVDFCKKPLNRKGIPDILQGLNEKSICSIHRQYQNLDVRTRQEIVDSLIEDKDSEHPFYKTLDALSEEIEKFHGEDVISALHTTFEEEITTNKKQIDFLREVISHRKNEPGISIDRLLFRALASMIQPCDFPICDHLSEKHQEKLNQLSQLYHSTNYGEKHFLKQDFSCGGRSGYIHNAKPEQVISGLEEIVKEIKLGIRELLPYTIAMRNLF